MDFDAKPGGAASGKLFCRRRDHRVLPPLANGKGRANDPGRGCTCSICTKRHVVLVSKDINMRIKARALDRRRGLFQRQGPRGHRFSLQRNARALRRFLGPARQGHNGSRAAARITGSPVRWCRRFSSTNFSSRRSPARRALCPRHEISGRTAVLQTLKDYAQKNNVWHHGAIATNSR
jgi:hypothetical protein